MALGFFRISFHSSCPAWRAAGYIRYVPGANAVGSKPLKVKNSMDASVGTSFGERLCRSVLFGHKGDFPVEYVAGVCNIVQAEGSVFIFGIVHV